MHGEVFVVVERSFGDACVELLRLFSDVTEDSNSKVGLDSLGGFQANAWRIRDMRSGLVLRLVVFGSLLRSVVPGLGGGSVALALRP